MYIPVSVFIVIAVVLLMYIYSDFQRRDRNPAEKGQRARVKQLKIGDRVCVSDETGTDFGTVTRVNKKTGEGFSITWDESGYEVHRYWADVDLIQVLPRDDNADREGARHGAELDALDAQLERNLKNALEQKATPEQRRQITTLRDQGWILSRWDNTENPTFYLEKPPSLKEFGERKRKGLDDLKAAMEVAMVLPDGQLITET